MLLRNILYGLNRPVGSMYIMEYFQTISVRTFLLLRVLYISMQTF